MDNTYEKDTKEQPIDTLSIYLTSLCLCTLESVFTIFSQIPEKASEEYSNRYEKIFTNYYFYQKTTEYFNNKTLKEPTISFKEFSNACNIFKDNLLVTETKNKFNFNMKELITSIEKISNDPNIGNSQIFNYKQRFWNSFINTIQIPFPGSVNELLTNIYDISKIQDNNSNTKYKEKLKNIPILYQEELPFYCILFYIYYCDRLLKPPFDTPSSLSNKPLKDLISDKPNTKIIEWCIGCYQEWINIYGLDYKYNKDKKNKVNNTEPLALSKYMYGIPLILQRFQYHQNKGKQLLFKFLNDLFKLYNKEKLLLRIPRHRNIFTKRNLSPKTNLCS